MRANLFAKRTFRLSEFGFLSEPKRDYTTRNVPFDSNSILGQIEDVPIHPNWFDQLLTKTSPSQVGIGSQTVQNPKIRSSSEIILESGEVYPLFIQMIQGTVQEMSWELKHPTGIILEPCKLVFYQKGDFFQEHIDNEHSDNMIMTLVVTFPSSALGGELTFEEKIPNPTSGLELTLFYNDVKHSVSPITEGRRMSLIFNVLQTQTIVQDLNPIWTSFLSGIQKLKAKGVSRIGFVTSHLYMSENPVLKGVDRIGWELFRAISRNVYLESVVRDDNGLYFEAILPLTFITGAGVLYNEAEESPETESSRYSVRTSYEDIALDYDESGVYRAVDPKYLMGNVVILDSNGILKLQYQSGGEIYLGNEGFDGNIHTNLGVFADI